MSWGCFVSFSLELTADQWKELAKQTPASVGEASDWAKWPSPDMIWYFTPQEYNEVPFAKVLSKDVWADDEIESAGLSLKKSKGQVAIEVFAVVDRAADQIHEVGCLARALVAAHRLGGKGSLIIASDGTAPENGWRCTVVKEALLTKALKSKEAEALRKEFSAKIGLEEED